MYVKLYTPLWQHVSTSFDLIQAINMKLRKELYKIVFDF